MGHGRTLIITRTRMENDILLRTYRDRNRKKDQIDQ